MTIVRSIVVPFVSNEPVQTKVTLRLLGVDVDPTAWTVEFAAVDVDEDPEEADWIAGTWSSNGRVHYGSIDVSGTGNGGDLALARGTYDFWIRIQESTTTPARRFGRLVIS